jgi:hypothetical protein
MRSPFARSVKYHGSIFGLGLQKQKQSRAVSVHMSLMTMKMRIEPLSINLLALLMHTCCSLCYH